MLQTQQLWQDGWLTACRQIHSPNFDARPPATMVGLIVLHSISLPPGEYGGKAVQQLFTNQLDWDAHPYYQQIRGLKVSSHFFIRRNGELIQFVSCDQRAWHAGQSIYLGRAACNDFSIGIELEGLEGTVFTRQQYIALSALCQKLRLHYAIVAIAGHEHIAPGRKHDPGNGFDWPYLQQQLAWAPAMFPEEVVSR